MPPTREVFGHSGLCPDPIVECLTTAYPPAYLGNIGAYWVYAVDSGADRSAGERTGKHSTDKRERTLNPRVQGSSPWGRTDKTAGQDVAGSASGLIVGSSAACPTAYPLPRINAPRLRGRTWQPEATRHEAEHGGHSPRTTVSMIGPPRIRPRIPQGLECLRASRSAPACHWAHLRLGGRRRRLLSCMIAPGTAVARCRRSGPASSSLRSSPAATPTERSVAHSARSAGHVRKRHMPSSRHAA